MPRICLTSFQQSADAIVNAKRQGYSTSDAAIAGGVHRSTIYTWLELGREQYEEPYLTFAAAYDEAVWSYRLVRLAEAKTERERERKEGIRKREAKPSLPPVTRAVPVKERKKAKPLGLDLSLSMPI